MFVRKSIHARTVAERDEARAHAQTWRRRADDNASYAATIENGYRALAEENDRLTNDLADRDALVDDKIAMIGALQAELEQLRQPRGARGRFGPKVRP